MSICIGTSFFKLKEYIILYIIEYNIIYKYFSTNISISYLKFKNNNNKHYSSGYIV